MTRGGDSFWNISIKDKVCILCCYLDQVVDKVSVLTHHLHVFHQDLRRRTHYIRYNVRGTGLDTDLNSGEDDSSVSMSQARSDPLTDTLGLPVVLRVVAGEAIQDEHLAPLRALVEGRE